MDNSGDYISREAALRANCYFCSAHLKDDLPCDEKCADYMKFMEIPAADVRPVVRARWERNERGNYNCSNCKSEHNAVFGFFFCPNCGADMRPEEE